MPQLDGSDLPQIGDFAVSVLIDTRGRFLLQQRDDVPGILYPGRIGLFGGHRERGETYLQCVVRELHEELGYAVAPERLTHLATFDGVLQGTDSAVHGEIFVARDIPADKLAVTEGSLLIVDRDELASVESRLSPSAHLGLAAMLDRLEAEPKGGS